MNIALIEDAEHDVIRDQRGQNQDWFIRERCLKRRRRALECGLHTQGHANFPLRLVDRLCGVAKGCTRRQIKGYCNHWKLPLMVHRKWRARRFKMRKSAERNSPSVLRGHRWGG